jgi:methylenetetrahydrofolate--tRNA-(uracil-5-)-methyltransferase
MKGFRMNDSLSNDPDACPANTVHVIGAGLAGCEAAWQIARLGVPVRLTEMKPGRKTPAHHMDAFAELVCSNSLRSNQLENASGLLKEELRRLGSLILRAADAAAVPAGGALAVDRHAFSDAITGALRDHPLITVEEQEVDRLPKSGITVIATGPLTTDALSADIANRVGAAGLFFFDAAAPIVRAETIDMERAFRASRYGKGSDDYINCPMDRETYLAFRQALLEAETVSLKDFEEDRIFEGCMPVESMARRGVDTMRFGPLKPVGLTDPATGREAYAVVQLRQDDAAASLYNLVGFQTHLKWGEQQRVFRMIPGLESALFERFGVMHRNTFLNAPQLLTDTYMLRDGEGLFFAGQMTGVEGYVESAASGWLSGVNAALLALGGESLALPGTTAIGCLARYISNPLNRKFQPMNVNFGIMDPIYGKFKDKRMKNAQLAERALADLVAATERVNALARNE